MISRQHSFAFNDTPSQGNAFHIKHVLGGKAWLALYAWLSSSDADGKMPSSQEQAGKVSAEPAHSETRLAAAHFCSTAGEITLMGSPCESLPSTAGGVSSSPEMKGHSFAGQFSPLSAPAWEDPSPLPFVVLPQAILQKTSFPCQPSAGQCLPWS